MHKQSDLPNAVAIVQPVTRLVHSLEDYERNSLVFSKWGRFLEAGQMNCFSIQFLANYLSRDVQDKIKNRSSWTVLDPHADNLVNRLLLYPDADLLIVVNPLFNSTYQVLDKPVADVVQEALAYFTRVQCKVNTNSLVAYSDLLYYSTKDLLIVDRRFPTFWSYAEERTSLYTRDQILPEVIGPFVMQMPGAK